ncbi:SDR family NAD(P)-dependent oxidoreductase [Arthrobacter sp. B2a2-09]|uniref:SDR family NAD(P)-dependent oxidoreductase n=1 Tax=Arthrobacter sp. B2a2-09 TaxID=2952822 RepID=UPI0022CD21E4|nr:SDR family oxidoreductase [Arthrobacter sp. B2a2-09]MCZ9881696.1 SDR family oxidoreductase [Arthrobacter sp. B2a2-09]
MSTLPHIGHPDLSDKVCLVTGAGGGIGASASLYLADCGATVILADRNLAATSVIAKQIVERGRAASAILLDVTVDSDVAAAVESIERKYGALHLAFNNAGVDGPAVLLHEQDPNEVNRILDVNFFGVYRSMRHEIPAMLRAGGGVILNTASVGGIIAAPGIGPYCASKHAVIGLTKSAAADYGRLGIRVNALAPGAVRTNLLTDWLNEEGALEKMAEMTPQGRIAEPEEMAAIVGWMLSDASLFMTGSVVTADGGFTAV